MYWLTWKNLFCWEMSTYLFSIYWVCMQNESMFAMSEFPLEQTDEVSPASPFNLYFEWEQQVWKVCLLYGGAAHPEQRVKRVKKIPGQTWKAHFVEYESNLDSGLLTLIASLITLDNAGSCCPRRVSDIDSSLAGTPKRPRTESKYVPRPTGFTPFCCHRWEVFGYLGHTIKGSFSEKLFK